jgi:hypothetical protein
MVLFLGDYIYEAAQQGRVRTHSDGVEAATLPTYGLRVLTRLNSS